MAFCTKKFPYDQGHLYENGSFISTFHTESIDKDSGYTYISG